MKNPTTPTGNLGEDLAVKFIKRQKFKILKRNWHSKIGEVDILARQKNTIIIVEVKTKTTPSFGHPAEMVNYYKQRKLIQLAKLVEMLYPRKDIRIDVVAVDLSVDPPIIEQIENAVTNNK